MRSLLLGAVLSLTGVLTGCDWAAADGPWNTVEDVEEVVTHLVGGSVCAPSGLHDVPGLQVEVRNAEDAVVAEAETDALGEWAVALGAGRYTVEAGVGGQFAGFDSVVVDGDDVGGRVCLQGGAPEALVLAGPAAQGSDLLRQRLSGLGLAHVHAGPSTTDDVIQLLASPAGLVDYGVVALLGDLDHAALAADAGALGGLRDHLERGRAVYLSSLAWPVADALAPGRLSVEGEGAAGSWVEADASDLWAGWLDWPVVGVPVAKDLPLLRGADGDALLTAGVETTGGAVVSADLLLRWEQDGGTVVLASFLAPPPRADGWWMGEPDVPAGSDGAWDGRGAVLDRVLLQL